MTQRFATPGELGGPVVCDVEVRDGLGTVQVSDVDEGRHEVLVHFPHDAVDTYKTSSSLSTYSSMEARMTRRRLPTLTDRSAWLSTS